MSRGLGVIRYGTCEGGSGFIANPSLPSISEFDWTQLSPVYDQETAWFRNTKPGTFTNYPRFGPPYSMDGGTLPPFAGSGSNLPTNSDPSLTPVPYDTSCGMGSLVLLREDVVAPMPSITTAARQACIQRPACPSILTTWIENNPWVAVGAVAVGAYLLFGGKR